MNVCEMCTKCVFLLTNMYEIAYNKKARRKRLKQRELVKKLESLGFRFERHGGNHDIYIRGIDIESVPRHKEINEKLAKAILRKWGLQE